MCKKLCLTYEQKYDSLLSVTVKCRRPRRGEKPSVVATNKPSAVHSCSPEWTKWKLGWKYVSTECKMKKNKGSNRRYTTHFQMLPKIWTR